MDLICFDLKRGHDGCIINDVLGGLNTVLFPVLDDDPN